VAIFRLELDMDTPLGYGLWATSALSTKGPQALVS
jgi:hypothetical protein